MDRWLEMAAGGERRKNFWRHAPELHDQALLQISVYGDSIVSGAYNLPYSSGIWSPQYANQLMADRAIKDGANYFQHPASVTKSSGVTIDGTIFTLTASVGDTNPRFANGSGVAADPVAVAAGELFLITGQLDNQDCVGHHLSMREFYQKADKANSGIVDKNFGGDVEDMGGYRQVSKVISVDYAKTLAADVAYLAFGAEIANTTDTGVGLAKGIEVYKLARGVAVINQGTSGWDAGDGLTNITTVTAWTPDVCVICFGTNDIRDAGDVATLLAAYLDNLDDIIDALVAASVYPVLATIPPLAADQDNYEHVTVWNAAIKALSVTKQCGLWDRYAALGGNLAYIDDGRHPNKAGYMALGASLASQIGR